MKFPRWVFTSPGETQLPEGSYGSLLVNDEQEYAAAMRAGYSSTVTEAMEKTSANVVPFPVAEPAAANSTAQLELEPGPKPEPEPMPAPVVNQAAEPPVQNMRTIRTTKRR